MKDIYNQLEIERVAQGVITSVKGKIEEEILEQTYRKIEEYLYEHYQNNKAKIEEELINSIAEEYIENPKEYKFAKLRKKMFAENKEMLTKVLTDEAIYSRVEAVIEQYTHRNYFFEWRWKDGIARFILENFEKFKDDERVNRWIGRELEMLRTKNDQLQNRLHEVAHLLDN